MCFRLFDSRTDDGLDSLAEPHWLASTGSVDSETVDDFLHLSQLLAHHAIEVGVVFDVVVAVAAEDAANGAHELLLI